MTRPRIGLLLLTAQWFSDIGASQGSFAALPDALDQDAARIEAALEADLDVVNPGVVATPAQLSTALERFRAEGIHGLIACQITWGEDRLILQAIKEIGSVPLLLWCYTPSARLPELVTMPALFRYSGPVGTLQASGPLKRLGRPFAFAFGPPEDPSTIRHLIAFGRAAQVAHDLQDMTIGVLPYRCDQMTGTYVDEFRLRHELGPSLKYISVADYAALCQEIPEAKVDAFIDRLRTTYTLSERTTQTGLRRSARASLGLARLVKRENLDAVALEDISEELHRALGLRPCLHVPELFQRAVVSMEAEVGGAVALWILRQLAGAPVMYTEVFAFDMAENTLLAGHAGIHDARLAPSPADILIEPDGEYVESEPDSAWMRFRAKAGPVTLLSIFQDTATWRFITTTGQALPGQAKLLGSPHALIRLPTPLARFFQGCVRAGMTQHWALVHADVVDELDLLAQILGTEHVRL